MQYKNDKTVRIMKADRIFRKAVDDLFELAKEVLFELIRIDNPTYDGGDVEIDVTDAGLNNVIIWGDDCDYYGVYAGAIDITSISFDGNNIYVCDEEQKEIEFQNLPLGSMVFVINGIQIMLDNKKN